MITKLLIVGPLVAVAPWLFRTQAATPKMLVVALGLYWMFREGARARVEAKGPALAFLAVCAVSWLFATNHYMGLMGAPKAPYYGLVQVALVVLAYIGATSLDDEPERLLVAAGAYLGLLAIVQAATGQSFTGLPLQGGRAIGLRWSPVMFAASLVPCFLSAWHLTRRSWFVPEWRRYVPMALILLGMLAARSKGALLATAVGVWVYETTGWRRWLGCALALELLWWFMLAVPIPNNRERLELLRISWEAFKAKPILGWGPDNFLLAFAKHKTAEYVAIVGSARLGQASAHQDIAQVAVTLGLAGLAAYLWGLVALLRASRWDPFPVAVLVAVWFQAQVNPIPVDLLVIVAVLLGNAHKTTEYEEPPPAWLSPAILAVAVFMATVDLNTNVLGWFVR